MLLGVILDSRLPFLVLNPLEELLDPEIGRPFVLDREHAGELVRQLLLDVLELPLRDPGAERVEGRDGDRLRLVVRVELRALAYRLR